MPSRDYAAMAEKALAILHDDELRARFAKTIRQSALNFANPGKLAANEKADFHCALKQNAPRDLALVHTVVTTATNLHDLTQTQALLHGKETAGHTGADKRDELKHKRIDRHIVERRNKVKVLAEGELLDVTLWLEHLRAKARAHV